MIHFNCLAVEAGFYSDVVECLPVDPATWVRFPAGAGKIFSLYDNGAHRGDICLWKYDISDPKLVGVTSNFVVLVPT